MKLIITVSIFHCMKTHPNPIVTSTFFLARFALLPASSTSSCEWSLVNVLTCSSNTCNLCSSPLWAYMRMIISHDNDAHSCDLIARTYTFSDVFSWALAPSRSPRQQSSRCCRWRISCCLSDTCFSSSPTIPRESLACEGVWGVRVWGEGHYHPMADNRLLTTHTHTLYIQYCLYYNETSFLLNANIHMRRPRPGNEYGQGKVFEREHLYS